MGHAEAIVSGGQRGYEAKRAALEAAGVPVAETPRGLVAALAARLG